MQNPYVQALEFLVDAGVDTAVLAEPYNRFEKISITPIILTPDSDRGEEYQKPQRDSSSAMPSQNDKDTNTLKMHADVIKDAEELASKCETLEDLKNAIQNFDGLSVKKTATQIVFADGNAQADVMVIGEAPGADEDRRGLPFVGVSGQLLDKILACINLSRAENVYISNILNWRPPGNRTPTKEEMEIATPFIMKHIELINPKMIILCGGVAAQTILKSKESISRLRGKIHDVNGRQMVATYHPAFLLRTPLQKKKVWDDMLMIQDILISHCEGTK